MTRPNHQPPDRAAGVMRREIETIPSVIEDQIRVLGPQIRDLAAEVGATDRRSPVRDGCGDSYFAGLAVRLAFESIAGVRCRPVEALELARYEVRYLGPEQPPASDRRVVQRGGRSDDRGSSDGSTVRGADRRPHRSAGGPSGQTGRPTDSDVVRRSDSSPGTSTYVAMVAALLVLAGELARARGNIREATRLDETLGARPSSLVRRSGGPEAPAAEAASVVATAPVTTSSGPGPPRAAAAFGAAKLFRGSAALWRSAGSSRNGRTRNTSSVDRLRRS